MIGGWLSATGYRLSAVSFADLLKDWQVVEEQDGSDNVLRQYVYGRYIDEPLTRDDRSNGQTVADLNDGSGDDRLFYHCNTQYSTFALTDETGSIVEGYQYDAYGRQTVFTDAGGDNQWFTQDDELTVNGSSELHNPYMFQGRRFDVESGMYFYRNRYYNSRLGRFISRDPMGVWYDVLAYGNAYSSFSSRPLVSVDPIGFGVEPFPENLESRSESVRDVRNLVKKAVNKEGIRNKEDIVDAVSWNHPTTWSDNRFIYTCKYGWIDTGHFWRSAAYGDYWGKHKAYKGSVGMEVIQQITGSESAWTQEDLASNWQGAKFGHEFGFGTWQYHDLPRLWENFLNDAGAIDDIDERVCCEGKCVTKKTLMVSNVVKKWTPLTPQKEKDYIGGHARSYKASVAASKDSRLHKCLCEGDEPSYTECELK